MTARKDVDQYVKQVKKRGWVVDQTRRGHLRFRHARHGVVFHSGTPGDYRGLLNLKAQIKRKESA